VSLARLIITAVVVEGGRAGEVAATYKVARSWVYELVARYRAEGDAAFEARSRRPHTSPRATLSKTAELIVQLRRELVAHGLDAGAETIAWHLRAHHQITLSPATIYRTLRRAGLTKVEPKKRPRSSSIRFQADLPNECWQGDFTHWRLADNGDVEILCWIDDHSRYAISVTAHRRVSGRVVLDTFTKALQEHGIPASTLTDNGMVFTTRLSGGKGGRNGFEHLLDSLGVTQKNSRPNHPTTCGKVERFLPREPKLDRIRGRIRRPCPESSRNSCRRGQVPARRAPTHSNCHALSRSWGRRLRPGPAGVMPRDIGHRPRSGTPVTSGCASGRSCHYRARPSGGARRYRARPSGEARRCWLAWCSAVEHCRRVGSRAGVSDATDGSHVSCELAWR
jgi:transposase